MEKVKLPMFVHEGIEQMKKYHGWSNSEIIYHTRNGYLSFLDYDYEAYQDWYYDDGNDEALLKALANGYEVAE